MPDPLNPRERHDNSGVEPYQRPGIEPETFGRRDAGFEFPDDRGEPPLATTTEAGNGASGSTDYQPVWVPVVTPRVRNRVWLHTLLLLLTIVTTTFAGILHWIGFKDEFGTSGFLAHASLGHILQQYWQTGFWYSATILLILGAHELGHYFACRYYRIDASLPYFMPVPPPVETGTLGAFIRIREPFPNRRVLFDVGIAGPIAGFVFAVPTLFAGIALSTVLRVPADMTGGYELGEPLIFKLAAWLVWGAIPDGFSLNMHPMAFAAWFGLLATMLNLLPIGQLDGGHIAYTVLGRRSAVLTRTMVAVVIALTFVSMSWLLWSVLMVVMLFAFGVHHPPTLNDDVPLGRGRTWLVLLAAAMLVLCFMPAPIQPLDLIR